MNITYLLLIILFISECLSLINTINSSKNNTLTMFIFPTIQSSPSLIKHYLKRRSSASVIYPTLNITDESMKNNMSLSPTKLRSSEHAYHIIKDGSNLTKTQIKVIVTVVIIIGVIMFIIAIFRFKNACRDQETPTIQTELHRQRISQYSEPSSRRGSIGYYTRKYIRTPDTHFDEQLNTSSSNKRFSVPASGQSSKSKATVILSYSPRESSSTARTSAHHYYVPSSCKTSNNTDNQPVSISIKPIVRKSCSTIGISRCDDQTPLLTSQLPSTIKNSSTRTTRKYSLNAFLPLVRSSNSHPLSPSSTTTAALGSNSADDDNKTRTSIDLKSRRRVSLSSVLRRNSFAKQSQPFYSTIDSTSSPHPSLSNHLNQQSGTADSDHTDRTVLLKTKTSHPKNPLRKKSSSITPINSLTPSYRKDFMQKIERFRFIDDSASSTTTVTSPVESVDRINGHQPCSHLITSAIEQFDDYVRSRYHKNDEIDSYIDRLNSDILTNGSYSDLNILNSTHENNTIPRPQTLQQKITSKPVNNTSSQFEIGDYRQTIRNSVPMTIPSQHSKHIYPSDHSIARPTTITTTNGHSRSMDFQSNKHELIRPITLTNPGTIYETSTSSIATLTSVRSSTSLEFDDDTKPSGVLVDDDFLPMSSPVDDHFWDMTTPKKPHKFLKNKNECFPNVGSSPDVEIKHFDIHQINPLFSSIDQPLSETSCDEDDDDDDDQERLLNQQKFSIHEYKLKELQKPIVIHRAVLNPSIHSTESTDLTNDLHSVPINKLSLDYPNDESLLEKFASAITESVQIPIRSPPLRTGDIILSSQQYPQTIYEEDDTQESSTNDNISDESADNGEIDLVHEFELSQKQEQTKTNNNNNNNNNLWSTNDRDIFILQEDDLLSALVTTPTQQINRPVPASIMKVTHHKSIDSIDEQPPPPPPPPPTTTNSLKPKVRFNLDPQYEREREWNKVNKLLGNSVEWTDEFEV